MKRVFIIVSILSTNLILLAFSPKLENSNLLPKSFKQNFAAVPLGKVIVEGKETEVNQFFISKTEVSNNDYNKFLQEMKTQGDKSILEKIAIKSEGWKALCGNEVLVNMYVNNPVYGQNPVVNISYEAAVEYCKWLTKKANQASNANIVYEFRLPTREEWIRAAEGNLHQIAYAWGGPNATNAKGCSLCQCNGSTSARTLFDVTTYTCPIDSYFPNSIGLYNMNGNVAEMVNQKGIAVGGSWASKDSDVKNESVMKYQSPSPLIGFRPILVVKTNAAL